jgi:PucR family transcriptional regulator, purine catabolism regulatory protein
MLTLRQALKLPVFEKAKVVAGEAGLDKTIRRVHVVDIPGTDYLDWGAGLLLFTAGYGMKDDPKQQAAYIPAVAKQNLTGLVFSTGWYFDAVPDVMRRAADEYDFPIIEMPGDVQFVHVIERLYTEILNEQLALKEKANDIHRRLTRLVLEGGDITAITTTLADILERSVLVEGPTLEVLAAAQSGPVDENRLRTLEVGRTLPEVAYRLRKRGVYAQLQQKKRPIRLGTMPDIGMWMERVVAPIVAGGEVYGYIWIVAGDHPLTELDELAIDHAATVAALALLKDQAVRDSQLAMRGDLLTQLLRANSEIDGPVVERARSVGFHVDRSHQVLCVVGTPLMGGSVMQLASRLEAWLRGISVWALVVTRERGVVVIIESNSNDVGKELAERMLKEVSHAAYPLMIGVAAVRAEKSLRRAYDEATEAADIGVRLNGTPKVVNHWTLGLLDWLYRLPPEAMSGNAYLAKVRILADHDVKSNSELVKTLEAYLEYGGALAEAAGAINVHRNTLLYRLGRIEAIAGVDLKDAGQRLNLHVALKGWRLMGEGKKG